MEINAKYVFSIPLRDIDPGECFYHEGQFYMMVDAETQSAEELPVVNLDTGSLIYIHMDVCVYFKYLTVVEK